MKQRIITSSICALMIAIPLTAGVGAASDEHCFDITVENGAGKTIRIYSVRYPDDPPAEAQLSAQGSVQNLCLEDFWEHLVLDNAEVSIRIVWTNPQGGQGEYDIDLDVANQIWDAGIAGIDVVINNIVLKSQALIVGDLGYDDDDDNDNIVEPSVLWNPTRTYDSQTATWSPVQFTDFISFEVYYNNPAEDDDPAREPVSGEVWEVWIDYRIVVQQPAFSGTSTQHSWSAAQGRFENSYVEYHTKTQQPVDPGFSVAVWNPRTYWLCGATPPATCIGPVTINERLEVTISASTTTKVTDSNENPPYVYWPHEDTYLDHVSTSEVFVNWGSAETPA